MTTNISLWGPQINIYCVSFPLYLCLPRPQFETCDKIVSLLISSDSFFLFILFLDFFKLFLLTFLLIFKTIFINILNLCITFNFINGIVKEPVQLELQPNPSKWNQVKKVSQRFASTTTVYGLTRVMKADSLFMKIVWALMTLLSLSVGSHSHSQCLKGIFKIWCRHTDKAHLPTVYFIAFGNYNCIKFNNYKRENEGLFMSNSLCPFS